MLLVRNLHEIVTFWSSGVSAGVDICQASTSKNRLGNSEDGAVSAQNRYTYFTVRNVAI